MKRNTSEEAEENFGKGVKEVKVEWSRLVKEEGEGMCMEFARDHCS